MNPEKEMAASKLKALWLMQGGLCFYCGSETWLMNGGESKRQASGRLAITTKSELRNRTATTEHLQRKADGGTNRIDNLVMACAGCNIKRMEKPVLLHLAEMRTRQ